MSSFLQYASRKQTEQLMLEICAGIACLELDPEQWITRWVKENYPFLEAELLTNFNKIALQEAWGAPSGGPFPNRGGFLSGLRNWFGSVGKGLKQGWQTAMNTPTRQAIPAGLETGTAAFRQERGSKTEDAFANAWKYVDALVNAFGKDPRIAQALGDPRLGSHAQGIQKGLGEMRDQLMKLGQQVAPILQGQAPAGASPAEVVPAEVVPGSPTKVPVQIVDPKVDISTRDTISPNHPANVKDDPNGTPGYSSATTMDQPQLGSNQIDVGNISNVPGGGNQIDTGNMPNVPGVAGSTIVSKPAHEPQAGDDRYGTVQTTGVNGDQGTKWDPIDVMGAHFPVRKIQSRHRNPGDATAAA